MSLLSSSDFLLKWQLLNWIMKTVLQLPSADRIPTSSSTLKPKWRLTASTLLYECSVVSCILLSYALHCVRLVVSAEAQQTKQVHFKPLRGLHLIQSHWSKQITWLSPKSVSVS